MTSQGDDAGRLDDAAEEREESSTTEGAAATGEDFPHGATRYDGPKHRRAVAVDSPSQSDAG